MGKGLSGPFIQCQQPHWRQAGTGLLTNPLAPSQIYQSEDDKDGVLSLFCSDLPPLPLSLFFSDLGHKAVGARDDEDGALSLSDPRALHGIFVLLNTKAGSLALLGSVVLRDAVVMAHGATAGGVILGKASMK